MASPPHSATSPPGPSSLALPKQRPTLALPNGATKSRKPSIASTTSSAHPLRQTSFPPVESLERQHAAAQYSPTEGDLEDDFSDSEIVSAISGPAGAGEDGATGKKRKRGTGKMGRPRKKRNSESIVNGEDGTPARPAKSTTGAAGENADDEDDGEDEETDARGGRVPAYEGAQLTQEEYNEEEKHRAMLLTHLAALDELPLTDPSREGLARKDFADHFHVHKGAKLRSGDVKKLVNQTVSQSVPPPVVLAVQAYTKLFAGMMVEGAREVQREWMAVEGKRADGEDNPVYRRLRRSYEESARLEEDGEEEGGITKVNGTAPNGEEASDPQSSAKDGTVVKNEPSSASSSTSRPHSRSSETIANGTQGTTAKDATSPSDRPLYPGGASALATSIDECDRGPLLPDHLREALRRYKKAHRGGAVGFTGYSLDGKIGTAARMGGRRLFR